MNSLLLFEDEISSGGKVVLSGDRLRSVQNAHDLKPGLSIRGGVLHGKRGQVSVLSVSSESIELKVSFTEPALDRFDTQIIVAVPRPQTVKKVLSTASALGVTAVHFIRAENVEKSYLSAHALTESEINDEIFKGLEQSGDTIPPIVKIHSRFKPFVQDELASLLKVEPWSNNPLLCLGHTANSEPLSSTQFGTNSKRPVFVAIGPEAGWSDFEVTEFKARGFLPISLGPRTLRVETALAVILGEIELLRGQAEAK